MSAKTEPKSGIFYGWNLGEQGWNVGMDANLLSIGRFAYHLSVKSRTLTVAPGSPANGDTYIVGASATGTWLGKDKQIAIWDSADSLWVYGVPKTGWIAFVEAETKLAAYYGGTWSAGIAI